MERATVIMKLSVTMRTDREPWEMGHGIASFLQATLETENPDQVGVIDVDVDDVEVVRKRPEQVGE